MLVSRGDTGEAVANASLMLSSNGTIYTSFRGCDNKFNNGRAVIGADGTTNDAGVADLEFFLPVIDPMILFIPTGPHHMDVRIDVYCILIETSDETEVLEVRTREDEFDEGELFRLDILDVSDSVACPSFLGYEELFGTTDSKSGHVEQVPQHGSLDESGDQR